MCVALAGFTRWLHRYGFMGPQKRNSNSNSNNKINNNRQTPSRGGTP